MNKPSVSSAPRFDKAGLAFFKASLEKSKCYLEYGCGGSTVYACTVAKVKTVVSVDSDQRWVEQVRAAVSQSVSQVYLEYCDIGHVGAWGKPISNEAINRYWQYMVSPWHLVKKHRLQPDTILIDGRFRIASFLFSLVSAPEGATILFDDYLNRPHYLGVITQFCRLRQAQGRMGVFVVTKGFSFPDICENIAKHSIVWI